jgi:putative ABC transport system permease protein
MWDALCLDVRHSFRSLQRAPTFSVTVIVTLTVAMGATTAVGSLLNAFVFRTLAVPSPEQLVALSALEPRANATGYFYADTFEAYRNAQRSFTQMSMYSGGGLTRVEAPSGVFDGSTETVSPNYFDLVGARLSAGRFFTDTDDAGVVISEGFRRRLFGNGPGIGEAIRVDAVPATVIGVLTDGFAGLESDDTADIVVPFALRRAASGDASRPFRSSSIVGRLARGVSIDAARAELLTRWPSIQAATIPATLPEPEREGLLRQRVHVAPLASGFSDLRTRYGTTLWVLLALMGMLLTVACANLAGLTLARALTRRRQVAIRLALGGSPWRVFWQLLIDGLLLSVVAFAGAVPLAWAIVRAMTASLVVGRAADKFPTVTPDAGVLAAMALLTVSIGLAIGVVAAWQSVAVRVDERLHGRTIIGSLGRVGRGLLVAQVALSLTLLVGAGLFRATLAHLRANDTSLQSQRIVFARAFREPGDRQLLPSDYYRKLATGLAEMPGAESAALSVYYPTYYGLKGAFPTDYRYTRADGIIPLDAAVLTDYVSPGFFELFRITRLSGRDVSWDDGLEKPAVALVSASLARAVFPAGDAVGQTIRIAGPQRRDVEIIGVVADAPYGTLDDPHPLVVFRPIMQEVARAQFPMAYVRASGDLATVQEGYTRVVKSLGHRSLRSTFMTSSAWVDRAVLQQRFTAGLAAFAAAITSLLACMGVYGMLAYSVAARVREIGVRQALGAARGTVVWMIVRDGLAIELPGVLIGAPCAWAAARLVRAQLYGIAPSDPRTLVIAAVLSLATVLAASLLPALRASRVAPFEALRAE